MVLIYLLLIHDHTQVLQDPRTLFCIYISKEFSLEKDWFRKDIQIKTLAYCRSTVGKAKLLCRSIERSTDMHQSASVHFGRPSGIPSARALLSVGFGRPPGRPIESFHSLVGNLGRSSGRPLFPTVRNSAVGGRPTAEFSTELDSNGQFLICLFLGLIPTTLWYFLPLFLSYINSGTMKQLNNKISCLLYTSPSPRDS